MPARLYIGNLPLDFTEEDVEDLFKRFGHIRTLDLKTPSRPPAFAFVEFERPVDAEEAVRCRDGYLVGDGRITVEVSFGTKGSGLPPPSQRRGAGTSSRAAPPPPPPLAAFAPPQKNAHRVEVGHLPPRTSWQDLKDHMRAAGEVVHVQVHGDVGVADYWKIQDMETALRKLHRSEFYGKVISVREGRRSRGRSRSRSPRR